MEQQALGAGLQTRAGMAGLGALAALALYAWVQIADAEWIAGRPLMTGIVVTLVLFAAGLALIVRMPARRAAMLAAGQAVVVAGLLLVVSYRYADVAGLFTAPFAFMAAFGLCTLPLPFMIAWAQGNWRDYAALFSESWAIVLCYGVAGALVGVVWLLILLSDLLLRLVGLGFVDILIDLGPAPFLITGAAGGFGMAIAAESLDDQGASLLLALLRPFLPAIVAVVGLFLLALPFRGLSNLFGELSAGATLMVMAGVAATLITAVVEARDNAASQSRILGLSARVMGVFLLILAMLASFAVAIRVVEYGWTPARLHAALTAGLSLGYGALYAAAMPRVNWMARIRQANITMSLALMALCALLLTPVLNAERIASASQLARLEMGKIAPTELDVPALEGWGLAGQRAMGRLREMAKEPGQEALAAHLKNPQFAAENAAETTLDEQRADLARVIPVQPASARAQLTELLRGIPDYALTDLAAACARPYLDLTQSCAAVVGDFLPRSPGEELVTLLLDPSGFLQAYGATGNAQNSYWANAHLLSGPIPEAEEARDTLRYLQTTPPALVPAPAQILPLGQSGVLLLP